jgi:hypothetical protein
MENIKKSMKYAVASIEYSSIAFYSYIKRTGHYICRYTIKIGKVVSTTHTTIFCSKRKCSISDPNIYIERFDFLEKKFEELNEKLDSLEIRNTIPNTKHTADPKKKIKKVDGNKKMLLQAIFHENKLLHEIKMNLK